MSTTIMEVATTMAEDADDEDRITFGLVAFFAWKQGGRMDADGAIVFRCPVVMGPVWQGTIAL